MNPLALVMTGTVLLIGMFTLLSALGDAEGFVHASKVWQDGRFVWSEAVKSALGFQFGVVMYWLALWKLTSIGIVQVELQTLFWFVATIVGVALISGRILRWPAIDQVVAVGVLVGVGWLLSRAGREI